MGSQGSHVWKAFLVVAYIHRSAMSMREPTCCQQQGHGHGHGFLQFRGHTKFSPREILLFSMLFVGWEVGKVWKSNQSTSSLRNKRIII
jgi:hypothetical protein